MVANGLRHNGCASGSQWGHHRPLLFVAYTRNGGAGAGFCVVSALAIVQSWMVASEIARARRRSCNMRNARYRGAQAKFRAVSLVGLCAIATVLPLAFMGAHLGASGRFATVMLGGVVFSTIAALTVLPVVIAWISE